MQKILNAYNLLLDNEIKIFIDNNEFLIDFKMNNLYHLLGFHKINDNDYIKKNNRAKLAQMINNGKITYDTISKSNKFEEIEII